ncbi:MAG: hypothetical protein R3F61_05385 [Myxococcota bacterium]
MPNAAAIPDRRAHFRAIMARLDGSGDPQRALSDGLYRPRPDHVAERIAKSLEIRPSGTHLVVGTIGSGKTTALLRIKELLTESAPETLTVHFDAGEDPHEQLLAQFLRNTLLADRIEQGRTILLIDGLDRTSDLSTFQRMVTRGLPNFAALDVGLVCVGPPQLQAVPPSFESDWFERTHLCGAVDITSPDGRAFLIELIATRGGDAFTDQARAGLVRYSGGIVRDHLLLARQAVEDAYIDGEDVVDTPYVDAAAKRLASSMLRAVTQEQLDALGALTDPDGLYSGPPLGNGRLILDRLLIPMPGVPMRLVVHPCVLPYLRRAS